MTTSETPALKTIALGSAVSFHFTRKDQTGRELDSSIGGEPLPYIQGEGQIAKGLETAMLGKKEGDRFDVVVKPEEGYGVHDEDLLEDVARENFKALEPLRVGTMIQVPSDDGAEMAIATIVDLGPKVVTIDRNHPYAGITLVFEVQVVSVRSETKS